MPGNKAQEAYNKRLAEYLKLRRQLTADIGANLSDQAKRRIEEQTKAISDKGLNKTLTLQAGQATDIKGLDEAYNNGLISLENYEKRKAQIQYSYGQLILENEIDTVKKILQVKKRKGLDITADQANLAKLEMNLSDTVTNRKIANDKKEAESAKRTHEERKKLNESIASAALQVAAQAAGIIGGAYTQQLNSLQDQIDGNNKLKDAETQWIASSTLSEQDKAAKLQILSAETAAKNEQLQSRQRATRLREARFNRDAEALQIFGNTLVAASKAGWVTPEAILVEVIGAAQLAALLAKPLPKFATGTQSSPEGLAIVGERGRELRIDPSGKMSFTPDKASMTYLQAGTKIIPNDEVNKALYSLMLQNTSNMISSKSDRQVLGILERQNKILEWQTEELKKAYREKGSHAINVHIKRDYKNDYLP